MAARSRGLASGHSLAGVAGTNLVSVVCCQVEVPASG